MEKLIETLKMNNPQSNEMFVNAFLSAEKEYKQEILQAILKGLEDQIFEQTDVEKKVTNYILSATFLTEKSSFSFVKENNKEEFAFGIIDENGDSMILELKTSGDIKNYTEEITTYFEKISKSL